MRRFSSGLPLRPSLVFYLWWVSATAALDAVMFGFGLLTDSSAYQWASDYGPPGGWWWIMAASSIGALAAIYSQSHWAARATLFIHGVYHLAFGTSIFYLTVNGATSAITGATKWWLSSFITIGFLTLPSLRRVTVVKGGVVVVDDV